MATFSERLKIALNNKNMKQSILAYRLGVDRSYISNYLSGKYSARPETIAKMAKILDVSEAWLSGFDVPMTESNENPYLRPVKLKRFPILGNIACGQPIYSDEEHSSYISADADIEADFCLIAKGDSMIGARINDGDVVFIKKQSIVDNGEIAVVVIENETTLKRWYYYPDKQKLILNPENSAYEPLVYINEELNSITCLGKAVCFMSKLTKEKTAR